MKATDLPRLNSVSRPTLQPDGSRAVVAVSHPDLSADAYVGQLWSAPIGRPGAPKRLTRGFRDAAPEFSPDGALLAFLRSEAKGPAQLFVVDAGGGEPVQVTNARLGVSSFSWAPGGKQIAFLSRVPEQGRYGTVEGLEADSEPPRHITTLRYRANGLGFTIDRHTQVFLVDVPDVWAEPVMQPAPSVDGAADAVPTVPTALQLTHGDFDHSGLSFSPDGKTLAVVSARHPERDLDLRSNVYLLNVSRPDAEPVDATGKHGNWTVLTAQYAPDGTVFFIAKDVGGGGRDFVGRNAALYAISAVGASPRRLTDPETIDLGEVDSSITVPPSTAGATSALVQNRTRGSVQLARVSLEGEVEQLTSGPLDVVGVAVAADTIVLSVMDSRSAGDLAVYHDGGLRMLTDFSAELRAAGILQPQELTVNAQDGYPVHGWVVLPSGDGPHPVLLNIHGGPFAQYSWHVFDEAQVYADAGYAVVMCNPRGSAGYGEEHGRAIRQAMGRADLVDVLSFLDGAVAEHPSLDADRVGIMGGSYGGYLTAWTIAHEHRFAAAIVERGYLDPEAFVGTSDIGTFFSDEYVGTDPKLITAQSPQAVVSAVRTPTLVLHSANDLRCPLSQAERYYTSLKRGGVDAELVIFPGENHELSRGGRPRHRLQRFEVILDWWARHLPTGQNQPGQEGSSRGRGPRNSYVK